MGCCCGKNNDAPAAKGGDKPSWRDKLKNKNNENKNNNNNKMKKNNQGNNNQGNEGGWQEREAQRQRDEQRREEERRKREAQQERDRQQKEREREQKDRERVRKEDERVRKEDQKRLEEERRRNQNQKCCGNDYIYVDSMKYPIKDPAAVAIAWSAAHTGIGADGLVLVGAASDAGDFSMRIFNADGSEAKMCGNACCCVGKLIHDLALSPKLLITLETLSGPRSLQLHLVDGAAMAVTVGMGRPVLVAQHVSLTVSESTVYAGTVVSMGNPHVVIFVEDADAIDLGVVGPVLERHPALRERTNVEFAHILDSNKIRMRVWERGSGITKACGTGACATLVAAMATKRLCGAGEVNVLMDGGQLRVQWPSSDSPVFLTGNPVTVFKGTTDYAPM